MKNGVYWIRFKEPVEILVDYDYDIMLNFKKNERTIITKNDDGIFLGTEGNMIEKEIKDKYEVVSGNLEKEIMDEILHERKVEVWINDDDSYEYYVENLKPSEIITMGAILQSDGLRILGYGTLDWTPEKDDGE